MQVVELSRAGYGANLSLLMGMHRLRRSRHGSAVGHFDLRQHGLECYYTIDAGPNVKVLCQGQNSKDIINCFESSFDRVKIIEAGFGPAVTLLD